MLATAVAAYSLLQSLVIPVLPTTQADLPTSQNTVTWLLTAYLFSALATTSAGVMLIGRVIQGVGG